MLYSVKMRSSLGGSHGVEGHNNQFKGFLQSVPLMRVEEMKLIEAEERNKICYKGLESPIM